METTTEKQTTVSFFTNCYENDWEEVLIGNRLEKMIRQCNYDFQERVLIINNVKDRHKVEKYAIEAVTKKVIDAYYFSEDYSEQILSAFSISRKSFVKDFYDGYWYSMGPLCAIFLCKTDHLLYFTCDCMLSSDAPSIWIDQAIQAFDKDRSIFVANPLWDNKSSEALKESHQENEDWYFGDGFSDQCFLVERSRLYGDIYNHYHSSAEAYPIPAGNLFEGRVNSYMRLHKLQRITSKHAYYDHIKLLNKGILNQVRKKSFFDKLKEKASRQSRKLRIKLKSSS